MPRKPKKRTKITAIKPRHQQMTADSFLRKMEDEYQESTRIIDLSRRLREWTPATRKRSA